MNIYHGSKKIIEKPLVRGSGEHNDYGPAFYVTPHFEMAKMWACKNGTIGVVNKYQINEGSFEKLKVLDLTDKTKYSILNWIAILMHFKNLDYNTKQVYSYFLDWLSKYYIDVSNYDVVIGYRADDAYFEFPLKFLKNNISIEDLEEIYLLGNLGIQYTFISERAIKLLKFKKAIECEKSYIGEYYKIVKIAIDEYRAKTNKPIDIHKKYILDLMREEEK